MRKQVLRSFLFVFLSLFVTYHLYAQVPQSFNYQIVVRDANDVLVRNQSVGLRLSIQTVTNATATVVYRERQTVSTDQNGYLSINVGRGIRDAQYGEFAAIPWSEYDTIQLLTEADLEGGTNYTLSAVQQLVAVPYAFLSNESQNLSGVVDRGNRAGMRQLKDVQDPTEPQDVLTKYHLDSVIAEYMRRMNAETRDTHACITPGTQLSWRDTTLQTQGVYRRTLDHAGTMGVDSVIILNLLVDAGTHQAYVVAACDSYEWARDGQTYTTSQAAVLFNYRDANGCPSTDTLHLTIYNHVELTATNVSQTLCLGDAIEPIVISHSNSTVSVSGLPAGVSYDATSGAISGPVQLSGASDL